METVFIIILNHDHFDQAFSQDLKSGRPKYTIGPAQMKNLEGNKSYEKQNDLLPEHPSG